MASTSSTLKVGNANSGRISSVVNHVDKRKVSQSPLSSSSGYSFTPGGSNGVVGTFSPSSPSNSNYSAALGASSTAAPVVDPYAQWGGQAKYNSLVDSFNTKKSNIISSSKDAAKMTATKLRAGILDFLDSYGAGQQSINERGIQNDLKKMVGTQGVTDMVGRGIRSSGVMLANKNASDSSAAAALANAYGDVGRRELSDIGNQYELEERGIGLAQEDLLKQAKNFSRDYEDDKSLALQSIVTEATSKLSDLDAMMAEASLPERIAIENEKSRIRNEAKAILTQYDKYFATQKGKVKPMGEDKRRQTAAELRAKGRAPTGAFQFDDAVPIEWQDTGPFASDLPLFTLSRTREE